MFLILGSVLCKPAVFGIPWMVTSSYVKESSLIRGSARSCGSHECISNFLRSTKRVGHIGVGNFYNGWSIVGIILCKYSLSYHGIRLDLRTSRIWFSDVCHFGTITEYFNLRGEAQPKPKPGPAHHYESECPSDLVLPQFGPKLKFEPELLRTWPRFGHRSGEWEELDPWSSAWFDGLGFFANPFGRVQTPLNLEWSSRKHKAKQEWKSSN